MRTLTDGQLSLVSGDASPDFSNVVSSVTSTEQMVNQTCGDLVVLFFSFACKK
jgi:hypothetical protein